MPRHSRKYRRGGGCVNSKCISLPNENEEALNIALKKINNFAIKLERLRNSKIYPFLNDTTKKKLQELFYIIDEPIDNNDDDAIEKRLDDISNFSERTPKLYRILYLRDNIMNINLEFDRPEEIYQLKIKLQHAGLKDFIDFDALNNLELTRQHIPESQELGGGLRKRTTRKKRGGIKLTKKRKTIRKRKSTKKRYKKRKF